MNARRVGNDRASADTVVEIGVVDSALRRMLDMGTLAPAFINIAVALFG